MHPTLLSWSGIEVGVDAHAAIVRSDIGRYIAAHSHDRIRFPIGRRCLTGIKGMMAEKVQGYIIT